MDDLTTTTLQLASEGRFLGYTVTEWTAWFAVAGAFLTTAGWFVDRLRHRAALKEANAQSPDLPDVKPETIVALISNLLRLSGRKGKGE